MEKNEILKIYGTAYKEMTGRLLEQADLAALLPADRNSLIGIKPNLVSPSTPDYGATTHTELIAAIIEYLQARGYRNLAVAEGSWVGARTAETMKLCGYDRLCARYGVPFLDMQKDKFYEKDCAGMRLKLCDFTRKMNFLINVPVVKGHCQTRMTCALKNMKGLIPNQEKRHFHAMGLHKPIAHLNTGIKQGFIVADHICGDLDFEDGGNPVVCNCIMAARDPVLLDTYVGKLMNYTPDDVPYIRLAEQLGVGSTDLVHARICTYTGFLDGRNGKTAPGKQLPKGAAKETGAVNHRRREDAAFTSGESLSGNGDTERPRWTLTSADAEDSAVLPAGRKIVELQDAVCEVESCSACYGYLIPALDRLREEGLLPLLKEKICIGQGYRGKTGELGVGHCTAKFAHSVPGCPPTEEQIYTYLREYLQR